MWRLRPLTHDYRSLDISPAMVPKARLRYPDIRVDVADARTREGYPDHHFGFVSFSCQR